MGTQNQQCCRQAQSKRRDTYLRMTLSFIPILTRLSAIDYLTIASLLLFLQARKEEHTL